MDRKQQGLLMSGTPTATLPKKRGTRPAVIPSHSFPLSNLNVTPRPTPRSRRDGLPLLQVPARAGGRDGADPAELHTHSERFSPENPLSFPLPHRRWGRKKGAGSTTRWASPPATTGSSHAMRQKPESPQEPTTCVPQPISRLRDSQSLSTSGTLGPATHTGTRHLSGSRRPNAHRRDSGQNSKPLLNAMAARDTAGTRRHRSALAAAPLVGIHLPDAGGLPRNPSPT